MRLMHRAPIALTMAALIVTSAACIRADSTAADRPQTTTTTEVHDHSRHKQPEVNACRLITEGETENVIGPVTPPREGGLGVVEDQRVCVMTLERDIRFGAHVGFADHDVATKYDGLAGRFENVAESLPDLGEEAVWLEIFRVVLVRVDDELLSVQLSDANEAPASLREKAIKLAAIAVERLPAAGRRPA